MLGEPLSLLGIGFSIWKTKELTASVFGSLPGATFCEMRCVFLHFDEASQGLHFFKST